MIWTQEDEDRMHAEMVRKYEEDVAYAEKIGLPVRWLAKPPDKPTNIAAQVARYRSRGVSRRGWHRRGKRVGER